LRNPEYVGEIPGSGPSLDKANFRISFRQGFESLLYLLKPRGGKTLEAINVVPEKSGVYGLGRESVQRSTLHKELGAAVTASNTSRPVHPAPPQSILSGTYILPTTANITLFSSIEHVVRWP